MILQRLETKENRSLGRSNFVSVIFVGWLFCLDKKRHSSISRRQKQPINHEARLLDLQSAEETGIQWEFITSIFYTWIFLAFTKGENFTNNSTFYVILFNLMFLIVFLVFFFSFMTSLICKDLFVSGSIIRLLFDNRVCCDNKQDEVK